MDKFLWNNTHNYYNAYFTTKEQFDKESFFSYLNINLCSFPEHHRPEWGECLEGDPTTPGAIMTDTFYAQVNSPFVLSGGGVHTHTHTNTRCWLILWDWEHWLRMRTSSEVI